MYEEESPKMKLISDSVLKQGYFEKFDNRSRKAMILFVKIGGMVLSFDDLFAKLVELEALPDNLWGRLKLHWFIIWGMSLQDGSHYDFIVTNGLFKQKRYCLIATFPGELE